MIKRLIICEPSLKDNVGHYFPNTMRLASAAVHLKLEVEIICNIKGVKIAEELSIGKVKPELEFGSWAGEIEGSFDTHDQQLANFRKLSKTNILKVLNTLDLSSSDYIIWPSVTGDQLQTVIEVAKSFVKRRVSSEISVPYEEKWYSFAFNRESFRLLSKSDGCITLSTNSVELGRALRYNTGHAITLRPVPHLDVYDPNMSNAGHSRHVSTNKYNEKIKIGVCGNAREEKGFRLILDAIYSMHDTGILNKVEFFIQKNDPDNRSLEAIRKVANIIDPYVTWIDNVMTLEQYQNMIESMDIIMVMYDPSVYKNRVSSVAIDAAIHGKPMIVSTGSWAHKEFPVDMIIDEEYSAVGIIKATHEATTRAPYLKAEAIKHKESYAEYHTGERIISQILDANKKKCIQNDIELAVVLLAGYGWKEHWYGRLLSNVADGLSKKHKCWVVDNLSDKVGIIPYLALEEVTYRLTDVVVGEMNGELRNGGDVVGGQGMGASNHSDKRADVLVIAGVRWRFVGWLIEAIAHWLRTPKNVEIWIDDELGDMPVEEAQTWQLSIDALWPQINVHLVVRDVVEEETLKVLGIRNVNSCTTLAWAI